MVKYSKMVQFITKLLPHLSEKVTHLGWLSDEPNWILVNHIILLYKYFIYLKRDDTTRVNFQAFKSFLGYILRIEEGIYCRKTGIS